MSKYRNIKTQIDGITFDSKKEAGRYSDLKLMERAGAIRNLRLQVPYVFTHKGTKICTYRADFVYEDGSRSVVEDVKGKRTRDYVIKRNLMKAFYGIEILET